MNIFAWNFLFFLVQNNAGVALEMLKAKPTLAKHNKDGETALYVLARNPSTFVSETRPCELLLLLVFFFNHSSCELF